MSETDFFHAIKICRRQMDETPASRDLMARKIDDYKTAAQCLVGWSDPVFFLKMNLHGIAMAPELLPVQMRTNLCPIDNPGKGNIDWFKVDTMMMVQAGYADFLKRHFASINMHPAYQAVLMEVIPS